MPFVGGLGDFAFNERRAKAQDQQTMVNQLLAAAGLAKDVWSTIQGHQWQQDALKAGSPEDQAYQRKLQQDLQNNKDWLDYQNQNPGKPADQLYNEWLQTPAGQAFQADQEARKNAGLALEHQYRMQEIGASQQGQGLSKNTWDAYDKALAGAATKFGMPLDASGTPQWTPGADPEAVRQFLYSYTKFADRQDQQALKDLFDQWIASSSSAQAAPVPANQGGTVDLSKITDTINLLAKTVGTPAPARANSASLNNPSSWAQAEKRLESDLQGLDNNPSLTPDEKQAVEYAYSQSARPGKLSDTDYDTLYRFVQALKDKYKSVMPPNAVQLTK